MIEPIVSRCQTYAITPPNKKDVAVHLTNILGKENVKFDPKTVAFLVNSFYPDIRKIINTAQQSSNDGELKIDQGSIIESDSKLKLVELLKSTMDKKLCFKEVRQLMADTKVRQFDEYYQYLYSTIDDWAVGHVANCILILAEAQYQDSFVVDKEIGFSACMIKVIQEIKKQIV
jgi:DNA polymerase III delta prime subunit